MFNMNELKWQKQANIADDNSKSEIRESIKISLSLSQFVDVSKSFCNLSFLH